MGPSRFIRTSGLRRLALIACLSLAGIGGLGVTGHGVNATSALAKGGKLRCATGYNFCFLTSVDKHTIPNTWSMTLVGTGLMPSTGYGCSWTYSGGPNNNPPGGGGSCGGLVPSGGSFSQQLVYNSPCPSGAVNASASGTASTGSAATSASVVNQPAC